MEYNKNNLKDYEIRYLKKLSIRLYKLNSFSEKIKADKISDFLYMDKLTLYFKD